MRHYGFPFLDEFESAISRSYEGKYFAEPRLEYRPTEIKFNITLNMDFYGDERVKYDFH